METSTAALIAAGLATTGWLYTARKARSLARKQHTINVMLQANFNKEFREALIAITPDLKAGKCPDGVEKGGELEPVRQQWRFILNHYEFISAGIRNGDFDERLVRDSERSAILLLFDSCAEMIYAIRDGRSRQSIYEHLEWLHRRWKLKPPKWWQVALEWANDRPFSGHRHNPHA